jgi:hypothetical protein
MQLHVQDLHRRYPIPLILCERCAKQHILGPKVLHGSHQVLDGYFGGGRIRVFFHENTIKLQSDGVAEWSFNNEKKGDRESVAVAPDATPCIMQIGELRYLVSATRH